MFRRLRRKKTDEEHKQRFPLIGTILMVIGALTVLYLFITEILMRVLAAFTPKG